MTRKTSRESVELRTLHKIYINKRVFFTEYISFLALNQNFPVCTLCMCCVRKNFIQSWWIYVKPNSVYKLVQCTANMFTTNLINLLAKANFSFRGEAPFNEWIRYVVLWTLSIFITLHFDYVLGCIVMYKHHPIHRQIYHGISFVRINLTIWW